LVIPKSDGLRKIRWKSKQGGKRGGVRIIYYFVIKKDLILLLDIYSKNDKVDLTKDELKQLAKIKNEEF
jgi:mRNA-degrading endonuclease RelE of RelBE toxin-antitoxin system